MSVTSSLWFNGPVGANTYLRDGVNFLNFKSLEICGMPIIKTN